jgi:cob(I)alamin adenosyltransferase
MSWGAGKCMSSDEPAHRSGHLMHAYYGFGRGKTGSAIGTAIRAAGAGRRVALIQFDKGFGGDEEHSSEGRILRSIPEIALFPIGCERLLPDGGFRFGNTDDDRGEKDRALEMARRFLKEDRYFLLVLDEVLDAGQSGLVAENDVLDLIRICRESFTGDMILTGRAASPETEKECELFTHFRKVKHYFDRGIKARRGIEIWVKPRD